MAFGGDNQIVYLVDPDDATTISSFPVDSDILSTDFSDNGNYLIVST